MSLGGVLWSAGSRGEILSQASNYWAEPHSKDILLIDYTLLTSNKTKVEKHSVCVALSYLSGMCVCVCVCVCVSGREIEKNQKAENTITLWCVWDC